jgi:hypothetical protein
MLPEPSNESVVSTAAGTEHQHMKPRDEPGEHGESPERKDDGEMATSAADWDDDARNPWNWPLRKKIPQLLMLSSAGFLA